MSSSSSMLGSESMRARGAFGGGDRTRVRVPSPDLGILRPRPAVIVSSILWKDVGQSSGMTLADGLHSSVTRHSSLPPLPPLGL